LIKKRHAHPLTATDAELTPSTDVDLFRIKIWDRASNEVIYDSKMGESDGSYDGAPVGGGNIKVHKGLDEQLSGGSQPEKEA
jgi:hypothetical protein